MERRKDAPGAKRRISRSASVKVKRAFVTMAS